jgi:hypothetical protein
VIFGGDFNCVLHPTDALDHFNHSQAPAEIVRGLKLRDTCNQNPSQPTYTCFYANGASRIDRIYTTPEMFVRKTGIEILSVAFTDHHAVALRIRIPDHLVNYRLPSPETSFTQRLPRFHKTRQGGKNTIILPGAKWWVDTWMYYNPRIFTTITNGEPHSNQTE